MLYEVNLKKEKKIAQKGMKKKFGKEVKNKKVKVKAEEKIGDVTRKKRMRNEIIILWMVLLVLLFLHKLPLLESVAY